MIISNKGVTSLENFIVPTNGDTKEGSDVSANGDLENSSRFIMSID